MNLAGMVLIAAAGAVALVLLGGFVAAIRQTRRQSGRHGRPPGTAGQPLPEPPTIPEPNVVVSCSEWGLGVVLAASQMQRRTGTFPVRFGCDHVYVCDMGFVTIMAGRPESYGLVSAAPAGGVR